MLIYYNLISQSILYMFRALKANHQEDSCNNTHIMLLYTYGKLKFADINLKYCIYLRYRQYARGHFDQKIVYPWRFSMKCCKTSFIW